MLAWCLFFAQLASAEVDSSVIPSACAGGIFSSEFAPVPNLTVDHSRQRIYWHDKQLPIMPYQYRLVWFMAAHANQSLTRDELYRAYKGPTPQGKIAKISRDTIRAQMGQIRRAFRSITPEFIQIQPDEMNFAFYSTPEVARAHLDWTLEEEMQISLPEGIRFDPLFPIIFFHEQELSLTSERYRIVRELVIRPETPVSILELYAVAKKMALNEAAELPTEVVESSIRSHFLGIRRIFEKIDPDFSQIEGKNGHYIFHSFPSAHSRQWSLWSFSVDSLQIPPDILLDLQKAAVFYRGTEVSLTHSEYRMTRDLLMHVDQPLHARLLYASARMLQPDEIDESIRYESIVEKSIHRIRSAFRAIDRQFSFLQSAGHGSKAYIFHSPTPPSQAKLVDSKLVWKGKQVPLSPVGLRMTLRLLMSAFQPVKGEDLFRAAQDFPPDHQLVMSHYEDNYVKSQINFIRNAFRKVDEGFHHIRSAGHATGAYIISAALAAD